MGTSGLTAFLDWIALHHDLANLAVFLISFSESLLIVGLFVPGALIMFGIGALVSSGRLDLMTTLIWAVLGAVAGDGLSFWLGYRYKTYLREIWPFSRYPRLFKHGEDFFARHGGKSVIFGRFVGPVRPVIPAIAGMMGLPPWRFVIINILSGLAWAPAYILPGVAFGASLKLASEVATRLAILIVLLAALLWFIQWLVRLIYRFIHPRANTLFLAAMRWSQRHRWAGKLLSAVIDPDKPELRGLAILGGMLVVSTLVFLFLARNIGGDTLLRLNDSTWNAMRALHSPWSNQTLVVFFETGSLFVSAMVSVTVSIWLMVRKQWLALGHWLAAVSFGLAVMGIVVMLNPANSFSADISNSHTGLISATMGLSAIIYAFLAVILAQRLDGYRQWLTYTTAALFVSLIALSHVYFGSSSVTGVTGGIALGLAWVAIAGIAYRRHQGSPIHSGYLSVVVLITLSGATLWQYIHQARADLDRFATPPAPIIIDVTHWLKTGWQTLPSYRIDLQGQLEQPLTIQWAGEKKAIVDALLKRAWKHPVPLRFTTMLRWLGSEPKLDTIPLLPQAHDGRHEAIVLTFMKPASKREMILRLWPSRMALAPDSYSGDSPDIRGVPVWVGYVAYFSMEYPLPSLGILRPQQDFDTPLNIFSTMLGKYNWRTVRRPDVSSEQAGRRPFEWHGDVLLIGPAKN